MIIFKIHYHKQIGKNNKGRIVSRHREIGKKSLYIPIDLNYFNYSLNTDFNINLLKVKSNYMYRNSKLILSVCTSGPMKGEFRYILKPVMKGPGDCLKLFDARNKEYGYVNYLSNFEINDILYNLEFKPKNYSKICISAECSALFLSKHLKYSVIKLPSNEIKQLNNKCYACFGKVEKNIIKFIKKAGTQRLLGKRPTVRGSAMNACDHPHGGGEGKAPIGRKYICSFAGKNVKGVKTKKFKKW